VRAVRSLVVRPVQCFESDMPALGIRLPQVGISGLRRDILVHTLSLPFVLFGDISTRVKLKECWFPPEKIYIFNKSNKAISYLLKILGYWYGLFWICYFANFGLFKFFWTWQPVKPQLRYSVMGIFTRNSGANAKLIRIRCIPLDFSPNLRAGMSNSDSTLTVLTFFPLQQITWFNLLFFIKKISC